jgi:hypothetical protein
MHRHASTASWLSVGHQMLVADSGIAVSSPLDTEDLKFFILYQFVAMVDISG